MPGKSRGGLIAFAGAIGGLVAALGAVSVVSCDTTDDVDQYRPSKQPLKRDLDPSAPEHPRTPSAAHSTFQRTSETVMPSAGQYRVQVGSARNSIDRFRLRAARMAQSVGETVCAYETDEAGLAVFALKRRMATREAAEQVAKEVRGKRHVAKDSYVIAVSEYPTEMLCVEP